MNSNRHSDESRNPAKNKGLRSRQLQVFVPLRGGLLTVLDSDFRRNDELGKEQKHEHF